MSLKPLTRNPLWNYKFCVYENPGFFRGFVLLKISRKCGADNNPCWLNKFRKFYSGIGGKSVKKLI
jgi:hypothetical protein